MSTSTDDSHPSVRNQFVAIVNPISGRNNILPKVECVRNLLRQHGASMDIAVTLGPEDATRIAASLNGSVEAVLVAGGDGTTCEVLNGLAGRNVPLAVLSSGTENLLAKELRMPREPQAMADLLQHGASRKLDVGVINGRKFMVVAGVGFDAECVARMTHTRRGHITHWDYFWPIWRTFWEHRFPLLRVDTDGETVFEDRGLVLIGNMSRYSVGLRPLRRARPDDGLLDVLAIPCRRKTDLMFAAYEVFRGRHLDRPIFLYRQCREVRITSPELAMVELDGEFAGHTPVLGKVLPGSGRVLVGVSTSARGY